MPRAAARSFVAVAVVAVLGLLVLTLTDHRQLAFSSNVAPAVPVSLLTNGKQVCQSPIAVADDFERVRLRTRSAPDATGTLEVSVLRDGAREANGTADVIAGRDGQPDAHLDRSIAAGGNVGVCVRHLGRGSVSVLGNAAASKTRSSARVRGHAIPADLSIDFLRSRRSGLASVPDALQHAAVFSGSWVGAWTYWLLLVAVLLGVPLLMSRALRSAARDDEAGSV